MKAVLEGAVPFASDDSRRTAEVSFAELSAWIRSALAARRTEPADDLLTDLASASQDGARSTEDEVVSLLCSIISAGIATVSTTASAVLRSVLAHPDVVHALRADRQLAYRAMDELLRYSAPASGPVRFATRHFSLGGKRIAKGQMLMLSFGGACRDPATYADPDTLRLDRAVATLPVFGRGPHYCLGAALARHELASMLAGALDLLPVGSRLRGDRIEVERKGAFRRPANLPVELA